MKKRTIIIYLSLIILIVIINLSYILLTNSFKLLGNNYVEINYDEKYIEKGIDFKIFNIDLKDKVKIKNNINNKKLGTYKVTYTFHYLIFKITKERIVNVIDKKQPIISLKGEEKVIICPSAFYDDEGYNAYDAYDKDITNKVKRSIDNEGNIIYEVSDLSNNTVTKVRKIIREDKEAPILKLNGSNNIYVKQYTEYIDSGYTVTDNCDVIPLVDVKNNVDTSRTGKYTVEYKATDKYGNTSSIIRNVIVYNEEGVGVIYLTFDDGPSWSGSTEKILNILKQENVKATFFVTSSGPDYLLKREFDEGHAIGLHTSTHEYGIIYKSIDNYFNDLNAVKQRVYRVTGLNVNLTRFPGGSNNTVSNRYNYGIMDILTKEVVNRGYNYFDWNLSSGDAGECITSECVYTNVINRLSRTRKNVILMHDIKMFTADALLDIIKYCKNNGYTFKVIDETTVPVRFK